MSTDHIAGMAIRNSLIVSAGRHYGLSIATCVPADPQSKGGSEATVRVAKADLVPTDHNLRPGYASFAELERACTEFCERVNTREHRVMRRAPVVMLAAEKARLHPVPKVPHTMCFGQTRKVGPQSTISQSRRAVLGPVHREIEERVWARVHGPELIDVHVDEPAGPVEVARHALTTPGRPSIHDEHYPPRPPGAHRWLTAAAAVGASRVRRKMAEAVDLGKLHNQADVDEALSAAARSGRFGDGDLASILAHHAQSATVILFPGADALPAGEEQSLQRSTSSWKGIGA